MPRPIAASALTVMLALAAMTFASDSDQQKQKPDSSSATAEAADREQNAPDQKDALQKKEDQSGRGDRWMMFKLTSSQGMFTELTQGNLPGVARHARASQVIDALEHWLRGREFRQRSEYQKQLNQYQFAIRELARHSEDGNIDGALESWLDVSRSCVECHKLLRDPVRVTAPDTDAKPAE